MASVEQCMRNNKEVLKRLKGAIQIGYDDGVSTAEALCIQKAITLAKERAYSKPIPKNKKGKPLYVRTGLYKASFSTDKMSGRRGFVFRSPVVYATHLEYKCGYNVVKDSTVGQRNRIAKAIEKMILKKANEVI